MTKPKIDLEKIVTEFPIVGAIQIRAEIISQILIQIHEVLGNYHVNKNEIVKYLKLVDPTPVDYSGNNWSHAVTVLDNKKRLDPETPHGKYKLSPYGIFREQIRLIQDEFEEEFREKYSHAFYEMDRISEQSEQAEDGQGTEIKRYQKAKTVKDITLINFAIKDPLLTKKLNSMDKELRKKRLYSASVYNHLF
ncbi:MAG: hypothetical protein IH840_17035, partial [Candidatus Heimdallarchaeota archaeon]|nr:hypothetical protein [Candidatus Heimdallarchaeota archaeon]